MRNWTIKEAIEGINANDTVAIKEISKHFPEFFLAVARNDMAALAAMMPEKFTVRRLVVAGAAAGEADDADEGETNEAVADDADLSAMSTKELIALCGQRGIKVPKYGKNKQFYLDALGAAADGEGDEPESDEDNDGEESEGNPYEGKSAMELYKECKKRGLKAEPKKKAVYYAELLDKDDAKADDEDAGDDEDWGDDEADEEPKKAPAKKASAKKAPAKKESKPTSKAKAKAEDDDDDWDI